MVGWHWNAMNILFVCTSNTCRSPVAAALLRHHLEHRESSPEETVRVTSAGIAASDGQKATQEAIEVMDSYGIDLRGHRATRLTAGITQGVDVILTMTESHAIDIALRFEAAVEGKGQRQRAENASCSTIRSEWRFGIS
ncbi:MAG: hypothetical protein ABID84_03035 [Chloroflexota bacterium]